MEIWVIYIFTANNIVEESYLLKTNDLCMYSSNTKY